MPNKSNSEFNIRIGKMLQYARESHKISQIEMAKAVGLTNNHISVLENGQSKASVELLLGYCKKLDMTPNELLGYYDKEMLPELKEAILRLDIDNQRKILGVIKALEL